MNSPEYYRERDLVERSRRKIVHPEAALKTFDTYIYGQLVCGNNRLENMPFTRYALAAKTPLSQGAFLLKFVALEEKKNCPDFNPGMFLVNLIITLSRRTSSISIL